MKQVPAKAMRESLSKEQRSLMQELSKAGVTIIKIEYKGEVWNAKNRPTKESNRGILP